MVCVFSQLRPCYKQLQPQKSQCQISVTIYKMKAPVRRRAPTAPLTKHISDNWASREELPDPDEILYSGSEDEYYETPAERQRRYEAQGQRYLDGKPLLIVSARLRGPFTTESKWQNPWRSSNSRKSKRPGTTQIVSQQKNIRADTHPALGNVDHPENQTSQSGDARSLCHEQSDITGQQDEAHSVQSDLNGSLDAIDAYSSHTPMNQYLESAALTRIRAWREEVGLKAVSRVEIWDPIPRQVDQGSPIRKRRTAGSEWLRRTISKRRRLETPDISPSPAAYGRPIPSELCATRTTTPSSARSHDLPNTSHESKPPQGQQPYSPTKAIAEQRSVHGSPTTDVGMDSDPIDRYQDQPDDPRSIHERRRHCEKEALQHDDHISNAVADVTGKGDAGYHGSIRSAGSSLQNNVDNSFDYRLKRQGAEGIGLADSRPPISKPSTTIETNSGLWVSKGGTNRPVECDQLADGEAAPDDGTGSVASVIDGPALVPSNTSSEIENQDDRASPVSAKPQVQKQGVSGPVPDGGHEASGATDNSSQLPEPRGHLVEIPVPNKPLNTLDASIQQDWMRHSHRANGSNQSSSPKSLHSDNASVKLPISQDARGLGFNPGRFIGQRSHADENSNTSVYVSPQTYPIRHGSGAEETMRIMENGETRCESGGEIISTESGTPMPSRSHSSSTPKPTPLPRKGDTPNLQQSPWVEEVVDIPYIPNPVIPTTSSAADSRKNSKARKAITSLPLPASGPVTPLPGQRCFNPLSSPASNDGPRDAFDCTAPEKIMDCDRDVTIVDDQAQSHPPSTPETKHSSLPTPDVTVSTKSFRDFLTPSPVRRRPKRVLMRNGHLPSTQVLFDAALSNPWKSIRKSSKRVSFAPLPGEVEDSPTRKPVAENNERGDTEPTTSDNAKQTKHRHARSASPPLNISQTELPGENTRFGKHFAAMTRKGPQMVRPKRVQRLLPSASQQVCASPGFDAMAAAFLEADWQGTKSEEEMKVGGLEVTTVEHENDEDERPDDSVDVEEEDDDMDDVRDVLENLGEFLDSFDVDLELEKAKASSRDVTTQTLGQTSGLGNRISLSEVNVWE